MRPEATASVALAVTTPRKSVHYKCRKRVPDETRELPPVTARDNKYHPERVII
jgi:hypothetical protein